MSIAVQLLLLSVGFGPSGETGAEPWRAALDALRAQCGGLSRDLETARRALLERAVGNAAETARLTPAPTRLRPPGYGVLPEVVEDDAPAGIVPSERQYSLERLTLDSAAAFRDAALLAGQATRGERALVPLVAEFERLAGRLHNLEDHIGYHAYWQAAVGEYQEFFAERNRLIGHVRRMDSRRQQGASAGELDRERREILNQFAPFQPTPGLALEERSGGERVLPVTVTTDIEVQPFLDAFREGVEAAFARSAAARDRRFRVELRLVRVTPAELYPAGPPRYGESIDADAHLARFPSGALVLTTGEESTHAWNGRAILLGPAELSRRTLAHEFAHLLGFRDAYLRGYDASTAGPFGAILVEWIGLQDDLMGNAKGGRVTAEMIDTLIESYGSVEAP